MFIVSKALLISSATVIVRARGAIWLNPFATVSFTVCSPVTVECCVLYPCGVGELCFCWVLGWGRCYRTSNYVGVKSSFQHARDECESKRAYVF